MARWYIEASEGESWRDVSQQFMQWIPDAKSINTFGWHEGDSIELGGKQLYCFDIPDHHGEKVALFEAWAKTTHRLYGYAKNGKLVFPNEPTLVVALRPKLGGTPPSWLR